MSVTEKMTYFTADAAEDIAELIEAEREKIHWAQSKQEEVKIDNEYLNSELEDLAGEFKDLVGVYSEEVKEEKLAAIEKRRENIASEKKKLSYQRSQAKRDEHRARTSLMAYKTALRIVLLEHSCRRASGPVPMPDPDQFLMERRLNPPAA